MVYDVEFYDANTEYDYEIDAVSGEIHGFDREIENYSIPKPSQTTASQEQYIGEDRAKKIALDHAGRTEGAVERLRVKLDRDDGRMIYEVDFREDRMEYEYEIDAIDGTIRQADVDYDD